MATIRHERPADAAAREALLNFAFGPCRFDKTSQRLRDGQHPAEGLSFVATVFGRVIGTVRLWHITAGAHLALLLGPLAVHPDLRTCGIGAALMRRALDAAAARRHAAVLLVGDAPYYARFGLLLARELQPGALDGAYGLILAARLPGERLGPTRLAPAAAVSHAVLPRAA